MSPANGSFGDDDGKSMLVCMSVLAGKMLLPSLIPWAAETSQMPEGYTEVGSCFFSKTEKLK